MENNSAFYFTAQDALQLIRNSVLRFDEEILAAYDYIVNQIVFNNVHLNEEDCEFFKNLQKVVVTSRRNAENIQNQPLPPAYPVSEIKTAGNFTPESNNIPPSASSEPFASTSRATSSSHPTPSELENDRLSTEINQREAAMPLHRPNEQLDLLQASLYSITKYFKILYEEVNEIPKFNLTAKTIAFTFNDVDCDTDPASWLYNGLDQMIKYISVGAAPSDRIGMTLRNDNFPEKPVGFPFRRVDQLSATVMMSTLDKVLQSNATFFANDVLRLHVDRISLPVGKGRTRMTGVSYREFCRRKPGILEVNNNDDYCLARALVLAIAWRQNDSELDQLKDGYPIMNQRVFELCAEAGVDLSNGGTREHIDQFQNYLTSYTIVVYNNRLGKTVYYEGPRVNGRIVLNLLLEDNHYNVITSFTSAFSTAFFCEMCRVRFSSKRHHKRCKYICRFCHSYPPCQFVVDLIRCNDCHRDFRGEGCLNEHRQKGLCVELQRCPTCLCTLWKGKRPHQCGFKYCSTCKSENPLRHLCYMAKNGLNQKKFNKNFVFVFYDFECRQETPVEGKVNTFLHEPNLCVAQNVCKSCIDNGDINQDCSHCGKRQHVFAESPVCELLNYISNLASRGVEVIALAHNMKGYDGAFILQEVVKNQSKWNPKIISTGTKIMLITCNNIKFLDSLNFLPLPLNNLPKTFNFNGSKGYFPHLFNTLANQNYVGPLPATRYYGIDYMLPKARDEFLEWYNAEIANKVIFNFKWEILQYCIQDVSILRKACLEFWKKFTVENKVDPFRECCTIAGACSLVYRRNFLIDNTIGIIPHGGYRMADNQSQVAIKWLLWKEHTDKNQIKHAGNGREVRLREGILVDGFCQETNTVYQFHGCYFHGCQKCYPDLGNVKHNTMLGRREKTEAVSARIRSFGYTLVEIRECDFKAYLKRNMQAAAFVNNQMNMKSLPLNPRDSFFGGRTNAVKLYHKVEGDEQIRYLDVCSLYPFVNKYSKYPLGHPNIHVGEEQCSRLDLNTVEGLIKCTVLPPQNLYHPVLPLKMHDKLMFILCRSCCETLFQGVCNHTQDERKFIGTYVADELRKAIEKGYSVLEVHEVWEYGVTQYNKNSSTGGLFSSYVDNFLQTKQECSGWPVWCVDDDSKDQYIREYLEKESIHLDKNKIYSNPGLRFVAKLALNSFWGKLAQRENLIQTSIISESYEFFKLMTDPSKDVQSLIIIDENVIIVNWNRPEESVVPLTTVNVVLAAYTTANARLELYKYLESLDRRVLYFDTDSVFFTQKPGEWAPPVGDFLGDLTDEIESEYGVGSKILEFVSGGPKNYAFKYYSTKHNKEDTKCKVKGITLNYKNSLEVNFEKLKAMIIDNAGSTTVETDRKISRTVTYDVVSKSEKKTYQVQYSKRRRLEDGYDTLPYGFRLD